MYPQDVDLHGVCTEVRQHISHLERPPASTIYFVLANCTPCCFPKNCQSLGETLVYAKQAFRMHDVVAQAIIWPRTIFSVCIQLLKGVFEKASQQHQAIKTETEHQRDICQPQVLAGGFSSVPAVVLHSTQCWVRNIMVPTPQVRSYTRHNGCLYQVQVLQKQTCSILDFGPQRCIAMLQAEAY